MTSFLEDLAYAARSLRRRPALLIVTTLTLSIGIAANAIMFGVVDQLLLRPPAHVASPDGVKRIFYRDVGEGEVNVNPVTTYPVLTALREHAPAFSEIAAMSFKSDYSLGHGTEARSAATQLVSGNYFRLLGVRMELGRGFTDDEDRIPQGGRVAVLGHGLWQQEFGGARDVLGRSFMLQGQTFTVIGVAPRGFSGVDREKIDVWIPISSLASETMGAGWHNTTHYWWARIVGRLPDGVAPEVAEAQATATYRALVKEWAHSWRDSTSSVVLSTVIPARTPDGVSTESKVSLWLMGVSAVVLLIACANVANLLIARTVERRREIAVRLALGVSRARLLRLLFVEAGLLSVAGALTALGVAYGASRFVQQVLLPDVVWSESVVDLRVLGFTLVVTVACVLLAGMAPALQGVRTRVSEALKASSQQTTGRRGALRFTLLALQSALSVLLLIGAGLFVASLRNVASRDVGVDRDRVLRVTMPLARFGFDSARIREVFERGEQRLRRMPGVAGVSVVRMSVPMGSAMARGFSVPGVQKPDLSGGGPYTSMVPSGFFSTVGAALVRGRDFTAAEDRTPSRVAIVNEALARAYWPDGDPIGQCVIMSGGTCSTVIGVARNVLQFRLIKDDRALVYIPPSHPGYASERPGAMLVRVSGEASSVIPMVRREIQALAPNMPFVQVRSYADLVSTQLQPWRLGATMFSIFGVIALIIAAVGLYSVMAYWVSQRTHEIGVRMALGAQRGDVLRLIAAQSSRAVIAGVLLGGGAAIVASRYVVEMLYEISPRDPAVYGMAALVLAVAAAAATIVPARRSTAIDPARAIRTE